MIEKGRISNIQAAMLAITSLTIIAHLILLSIAFNESKQDSWIAAIIGTGLGLIGIITVTKLSQCFPGLTLIEILFQHFKWPGKLIGILYLVYFYIMAVLGVRLFAESYKLIMIDTPLWVFVTVILSLCSFIVYLGLETLGRLNQIMLPTISIIAITLVFLTMGKKDYSNLLPILGNGLSPVALGSLSMMAWFGEFVIIGMILPYVQRPKKLVKVNIVAAIVTLILFLGPVTGPIALFGPVEAAKLSFPTFEAVRYIEAGEVLNRFDAIAVLFWTVGLMVRVSLFFYGLSLGAAQALKLKTYHPLVIPLTWLIGVGAILFVNNFQELKEFLFLTYVQINLLMGAAIPVFLFIVARLFLKRKVNKNM
jgi:spore germination protein KB